VSSVAPLDLLEKFNMRCNIASWHPYRVESIFHWYLEQRKNERSGCLAGFVDVLPRLGEAAPTGAGDRAPGLLVGFASAKVVDTTFAEFRGCGVCVNSPDELGIALTAHELSVAQSDFFFCFAVYSVRHDVSRV
jgi:hypothetical protein